MLCELVRLIESSRSKGSQYQMLKGNARARNDVVQIAERSRDASN